MSLLNLTKALCRDITGSKCNVPRLSTWRLVDPGQINLGVDVADLGTGGATALFPVNAKVYGSYFRTGLERDSAAGGMSVQLTCYGGGVGVGAGWSLPFVAGGVTGNMKGLAKEVTEALGTGIQGTGIDLLKGGWSAGTQLVAGPDSTGDLSLEDFRDAVATVIGLGANFIVNGVSAQLIIFSKKRPVMTQLDMIYAKAVGLTAGIGFAVSLDVESNMLVYKVCISGRTPLGL